MALVIFIFLACSLIFLAVLQYWSYPGKPRPFLDENGKPLPNSIAEKVFVDINGFRQGMFIKGKDTANPVLLYLHGGMPDYFLTRDYPIALENYFTVIWWDQRGSGLSFSPDIPPESMTAEQFISDIFEVTNYLRRRFNKDKIYLMGHSGGTFIGIRAAAREPELYFAYIGVEQISYQLKSEALAYEYMLKQFKENGNTAMVRKLEAAPVSMIGGIPDAYLSVRDEAMHTLGVGTIRDMKSVFSGLFVPSLQFREYTLGEKINLWRGKIRAGVGSLWSEMKGTDLTNTVTELGLPVYFFHGKYDYTVSYTEARSYFDRLKAPMKGFYTFQQSAHSPIFEEPERTLKILNEDVLAGATSLADIKQ